ncbi:MAG: hypothetical protein DA408_04205 [Bacteroidetes bacterium]|nr:MAG: hypothetical protein C7N36_04230 [Bacteroidota bacterium]PTM14100.1 MAG: hypothetical protein DA408_04205 [Bacteroidota bacterium]
MGQFSPKFTWTTIALVVFLLPLSGQNYLMNGMPINDCSGYFLDSGGSANSYGPNENFTTTICSDASTGTHVQLVFSGIDIGPGESIFFYDAPTADPAFQYDNSFLMFPNNPFIIQATAANTSGCVTIVFTSDGINGGEAGWSADINCIAACQTILADLASTIPAIVPVDTGYIDICPGQRVTFSGTGIYPQNNLVYNHSDLTSSFEWDFGNGNTAIGPNVTNVFDEPGGYTVQMTITDQFGCKNTNFISQRVRVSTYPTYQFSGTLDPTICSGDSLMITSSINETSNTNVVVTPTEGTFVQDGVRSDTLLLPDGSGGVYRSSIPFTQFRPGATLTNPADINFVSLNLEHSYSGDLDIELICPNGSSAYILQYGSGLGSTNFGEPFASAPVDGQSANLTPGIPYTYVFVENAARGTLPQFRPMAPSYTYTTVPSVSTGQTYTYTDTYFPAGEYRPQQSFANLVGCPLNGDWTIRVQDNLGLDNGWLFEWSISFADYLYPNVETFTPTFVDWGWSNNPTVISSTQDSLLASPINAGFAAYTFWVLDNFGCLNDSTLTFEILPPTHPDCYTCNIQINDQEDVAICQGESTNLDLSPAIPLEQEITFERFPQYTLGRANHPPGNPYRSVLSVNSISPVTITNPLAQIASICLTFTTDFTSDINLVLRAPNGSQLPLSLSNGGGSNLGYVNTCFSPTALTSINAPSSMPPYTGTYQPQGNWNTLIGSPVNGDWTLLVTDAFGPLQFGELLEWSITFNNLTTYTYSWTPTTGLSPTTGPTPTASPVATTTYVALIQDNYGCSRRDTVLVSVIPDAVAPVVSCQEAGESILFTWLPIPGVTEYEYNIILPSGPLGWTGPLSATQLQVDNLNNNDEVTLEVRAYFAGTNANCPIPIGSATCVSSFCGLQVSPPTLTDVSCFGATDGVLAVNITAGEGPFSIVLDGVTYTNPVIPNLAAGDYTYTVLDALGCAIPNDFTIGTPDSLFATVSQTQQSCANLNQSEAVVVPGGGTGGFSYAWSNGQQAATVNNLAPGNVQVTVTDNSGCTVTASANMAELAPITFDLAATSPTCNGAADGSVAVSQIAGGIGTTDTDYLVLWQDGVTTQVRPAVPGGITYQANVADAQGCISSQTVLLPNPVPVTFNITAGEPSCNSFTDGSATVVNLAGPNGNTFSVRWDSATGAQNTTTATNLAAGTYSVTVTDPLNCEATQTVSIGQPSAMAVDFSIQNNKCFGFNDGAITVNTSGGSPGYTYRWPGGATTPNNTNLVTGDYTITITDTKGCEVIETATVAQPLELTLSTEVEATSCYQVRDGRITVLAQGGTPPFRYSLNTLDFFSTNVLIGLEAGDYNILVKDNNGCQLQTSAIVLEPAEFMVDAGPDLTILYGDSIELAATASNAQGMVEFVWQAPYAGTLSCDECIKPFASPVYTIDYELYAIDENGCDDTDMIRVFVEKPKLAVVPTGFTPNNDTHNDLLLVHGRPGTQVLLFQIFDRWGELVYVAEDFPVNQTTVGWDGTYRDQPMNPGVFIWSILVRHEDGTEENIRGQTTLIR